MGCREYVVRCCWGYMVGSLGISGGIISGLCAVVMKNFRIFRSKLNNYMGGESMFSF